MHARRDQGRWAHGTVSFAVPTDARQTTLVGADDWRDETGLATWLANLVRYTLYSETVGIVLRSARARRPRLIATAGVAPGRASAWWDQICADIPEIEAGNESISRSTGLHAVREEGDTHDPASPDSTTRRIVRLVLPLLVSERRLGALIVEFRFGKRVMPDVLLRTRALAQLVALALDHGRLMYEREAWANTVGQLRQDSENTEAALMQIVHELRGPLTTMKLGTQIAQRQLKRVEDSRMASDSTSMHVARATAALALVDRNTNMAERLLSDLADITRIRVGIAETHTSRCDLSEILHDTVAGQRLVWRRRIIHLESPTEAIPVVADADRIAQVVGNYLSNALRYSPNVQPVEVRLERGDGEARVAVCDHGVGIALEHQPRVWERFYRASGSSKFSAEGLGLGLFICRQLVEQMGGKVGVESVPGEGSTFWFTVPLAAN